MSVDIKTIVKEYLEVDEFNPNRTIEEIVRIYLEEHEYGGLIGDEGCGCFLGELMPCGCPSAEECQPAYVKICNIKKCEQADQCEEPRDGDKCLTFDKEVRNET